MCSIGRRQAVNPAKPKDAAINFRTFLRDWPSSISVPPGNSLPTQSRNSGVSASWFRLRQYCAPVMELGTGLPLLMFTKLIGGSPMTNPAVRRWIQMFLGDDLVADLPGVTIGNPIELGHQFGGPYIWRGVFMACQTERHVQGLVLMHFDHLVDAPVAAHAAYAGGDVSHVIKIDEVGKLVNLDPGDRQTGRVALADRFEARALGLHARMTVHAGFGRGDRGVGGFINGRVTVEAIQSQLAGVQLVAVGYRLDGLEPGFDIGRVGVVRVAGNSGHRAKTDHGAYDL